MESVKIIALCVGAAIAYGVLQDQVTARVCVEYFTIGHPPISEPRARRCSALAGASWRPGGSECCSACRWRWLPGPAQARESLAVSW
jgi:hypothetical protein